MKLKIGDIITVHGWVMLKGLEPGKQYRVNIAQDGVYWFNKLTKTGRPVILHQRYGHVGHKAAHVDSCIGNNGMNTITIN